MNEFDNKDLNTDMNGTPTDGDRNISASPSSENTGAAQPPRETRFDAEEGGRTAQGTFSASLDAQSQPTYGDGQPSQPRPTYGAGQPAQSQPTYGAEQPAQPRPTYGAEQPAQPRPAYGAGQPAQAQPTYGAGQPAQHNPAHPPRYEYSYRNGQAYSTYGYGGEHGYGTVGSNGTYSYSAPVKPHPEKKPKAPKKFGAGFVCAMLAVAVIVSSGLGIGGSYLLFGRNGAQSSQGGSSGGGNTVIYENSDSKVDASQTAGSTSVADVVAAVEDSVVEITTEKVTTSNFFGQYVTKGAGSGVVISADGYIVTNNHVVEEATNVTVTLTDRTTYDATIVGRDEKTDVAVIKINATGLTPAVLGDSSKVVVGQDVIVIGNPLGSLGGSVTAGIVSALDRQISVDDQTMTLMQVDAAVNPGNSGGGAFDANGNLIGIVNAKTSGSSIDNLGFAIPVNIVKPVIADIIEYGYVTGRISTGFEPIDLTDSVTAISYRVSRTGIYVYRVTDPTSPFRSGDLLVSMDGTVIASMTDYNSVVDSHKIGDTISVTIIRNGEQKTVSLTFGEYIPSDNG